MPQVNLTDEEWRTVMAVMAKGPWDVVNTLLMKIGDQLRTQKPGSGMIAAGDGNTEAHHAREQRRTDARKPIGGGS